MSKVFRFHTGQNTLEDWQASQVYGKSEIDGIADPTGGTARRQITSIPSPFARIDLVQTAFAYLAQKQHPLEGNTIYHKMVSDALDVGEIFFKYDQVTDLKIITWDRENNLQALLNSANPKHKLFGETLELYLDQDAQAYNFDKMQRLYLLEYKDYKIIGGTSPATLFFTTANDLSGVDFWFDNNRAFDDHYTPLYKRDPQYQKFLHHLFKAHPEVGRSMKDVLDYLNRNLEALRILSANSIHEDEKRAAAGLFDAINRLAPKDFSVNYDELDTGRAGDTIEYLGVTARKLKKIDATEAVSKSDFLMQPSKYNKGPVPLVLQNNLNKKLRYLNELWNKDTVVPYQESQSVLEKRILPGQSLQYPYVTVSDFLEPYLVRTVYQINRDKFFDGNISYDAGADNRGYILPINKLFFEFFNTRDLVEKLMPDGKPMFEMRQIVAGAVVATLRIPIGQNSDYIVFERIYYPGQEYEVSKAEPQKNKGIIIENQFSITLFPFLKLNNTALHSYYRVQLVNRDVSDIFRDNEYSLQFYANQSAEPVVNPNDTPSKHRSTKVSDGAKSEYYAVEAEFDFIELRNNITTGIIIPKWRQEQIGNDEFTFSIDFGTTNTHIEYKVGASATPKPFEISEKDMQIATLFNPKTTDASFGGSGAMVIRDLIPHEFVPETIDAASEFHFPQRTVIAESKHLNLNEQTFSLSDFNIPFIYERGPEKGKITTNLKWAKKEKGNDKRVRAFFETLLMLMRNKVLLNFGNLKSTRLIWFYPSSMKKGRVDDMKAEWESLFTKYFGAEMPPISLTEAVAPFYYYKQTITGVTAAARPVVSVDIGGGTSDVVIFKENKPFVITSFKFAANTLFGDAYSNYGAASSNGLIIKYFHEFNSRLESNKLFELKKILEELKNKNRSDDINTFLFSLESNSLIKDKALFSYSQMLASDDKLKIVFLYFYAAIIYHIGRAMRYMNIDLPGSLLFSGTGSKILRIISSSNTTLADFSKLILEKATEKKYGPDGLRLIAEPNIPKEVTCKGGLMATPEDIIIDTTSLKRIYSAIDAPQYEVLRYNSVTETVKNLLLEEIEAFHNLFKEVDQKLNFTNTFNLSAAASSIFYNKINSNLGDYLMEGLAYNRKLDDALPDDMPVEESMFFYPLIGKINEMIGLLSGL